MDLRLRLRLRRPSATKVMAPIASKAAPPMAPPAIAPVCDFDFDEAPDSTGLTAICREGALRIVRQPLKTGTGYKRT
jgi:hypothetical protein